MIKINNLNIISFKSKIKFVGQREWESLPLNMENFVHPVHGFRASVRGKDAYTISVAPCIASGIANPEKKDSYKVFMFHIPASAHLQSDYSANTELIGQEVDNLKTKCRNPNQLYIGGEENDVFGKELIEDLETKSKSLNIDYSVFFGQKNGSSSVFYSGDKDTFFVRAKTSDSKTGGLKEVRTAEDVKAAYSQIRVSPNDEVIVKHPFLGIFSKDTSVKL